MYSRLFDLSAGFFFVLEIRLIRKIVKKSNTVVNFGSLTINLSSSFNRLSKLQVEKFLNKANPELSDPITMDRSFLSTAVYSKEVK